MNDKIANPDCTTCKGKGYLTGGPDTGFDDYDCLCVKQPWPDEPAERDPRDAKIEKLEATLRHIATMDCFTYDDQEPVHMLMMRLAAEAITDA